ncbi:MAG: hypothetical protein HY830_09490 [Actinobacteria bacterium]|nr:hypothetical protein [Actinomycetota bacterium]
MSTPTGTPGNQARGADSTLADGRPTPEHPGGHRDGTAVRHDDPTLVRRDDEPTLARPEYATGPDARTDDDAGAAAPHATATELGLDRQAVVQREKEAFGGLKIGSAFFGWLAATGMAVILTALLAGAGTAVGVATNADPAQAVDAATGNIATVGWGGAVALAVIVFVAFYCGGYVAGRMARFNGAKQGVAVWLWTVVVSLVVAGVGAALGSQYDVLGRLDAFPRIPVGEGDVTTAGLLSLLVAVVVALVGAVVGGLAGMRFHRKVDKAGLGR